MERCQLGETGMQVSRLGAGLAEIGLRLSADQAAQGRSVFHAALDNGINFLDTTACYGASEELIDQADGRSSSSPRKQATL